MADKASHVGATPVNNPLLSAAGNSFPFENFTSTAQLVPISQRGSSIQLSEDVGEADSFLGQDAVPSLPLPGVLPPVLKTPSAEQLQPITFFNALGQPTGGGGLDFLAPAGANSKSIDSSNQPRYKPHVNKRRPLSASLGLSPSKSLISSVPLLPPASQGTLQSSSTAASAPSISQPLPVSHPSLKSPTFQEPSVTTQLSLLPPKSHSTPPSPKTQFLQSSLLVSPPSSKSQPSTLQPSPTHVSKPELQINQVPSHSSTENLTPKISTDKTFSSDKNQLSSSLTDKLLTSTAKTLNLTSENYGASPQLSELVTDELVAQKTESLLPLAVSQVTPDSFTESKATSPTSTELVKTTVTESLFSKTQTSQQSVESKIISSPIDKLETYETKSFVTTVTAPSLPVSTDSFINTTTESLQASASQISLHHSVEHSTLHKFSEEQIISSPSSVEQTPPISPDLLHNKAFPNNDLTPFGSKPSLSSTADKIQNLLIPSENQVSSLTEAELLTRSTQPSTHILAPVSERQISSSPETEPQILTSQCLPPCTTQVSQLLPFELISSQSSSVPTSFQSFSFPTTRYPCVTPTHQHFNHTSEPLQFYSPTRYQSPSTQHILHSSQNQFPSPDSISDCPQHQAHYTPSQSHSPPETQIPTPLSQHQSQYSPSSYETQPGKPSSLVPQFNSSCTHTTPPTPFFVSTTQKAESVDKTRFYSPYSPQAPPSQVDSASVHPPPSARFLPGYPTPFPPTSTQFGPLSSLHSTSPLCPTLQSPLPPPEAYLHTTSPAAQYLPPPPLTTQGSPHHPPSNRYSIHARPLKNPYKAYTQPLQSPLIPPASQPPVPFLQPKPPTPSNNSENQAITYLVPSETSSESLATVPLRSEATLDIPKNPIPVSGVHSQLLPTSPLSSSISSAPTPLIGTSHPNPFSAQAALSPLSYSLQELQDNNVLSQQTQLANCSAALNLSGTKRDQSLLNHLNPAGSSSSSPFIDSHFPPERASPSSRVNQSISPQGFQEYSHKELNTAIPANLVPTTSSCTHPPSGILLGTTKGYRLGRHKPRYAQVPDLAVSPSACSSVLSPLNSGNLPLTAASEPFSIYPPGGGSAHPEIPLSTSEEYLVPSGNFVLHSEVSPSSFANLASQTSTGAASAQIGSSYHPVYCHWFFKKEVEAKVLWKPFSVIDSVALENAFNSSETTEETVVATDGGRYDVKVLQRQRVALYWEEKKPTEVRRCSWFYKGPLDSRYTPYEEDFADQLEEEYKLAMQSNKWNRKIEHSGETVVMHGPVVMVHYSQTASADQIGVPSDTSPVKPRVVKRGVDEFEFEEGEPSKVDHLLFLVHGIGSVCDLKFRDVVETVDDFRSLALQLTRSHFSACVESGQASRVEVLPVSWHGKLHGEDTGIDRKLQSITLKSIPRLRHFTNDTLLDILFYTSPVYCQTIMDTVGNEMNRMYEQFLKRNPDFAGSVSLGGHSLGSLILFDLLYHQKVPKHPLGTSPAIVMTVPGSHPPAVTPVKENKPDLMQLQEVEGNDEETAEGDDTVDDAAMALSFSRSSSHNRRASRVNYMVGPAGTGQPYISYPQLNFKPENFFALGSPIGMFVTVRGIETLGSSFRLPTCPGFFNIFHPFDPVAYRIESLIDPELAPTLNPVLIPHHKGRKRMHLELKETMARVGSDLKNKLVDSVKSTWNTMTQYTMFSRPEPPPSLEQEVTKVLEAHLGPSQLDTAAESESEGGEQVTDVTLGCLNGGRRVDYVLQEAPLESFNEYLFALQSHVCYWESEDTMLMILTEVYRLSGVSPDSAISGADLSRERSPIKMLSDQLLQSASPPKPQIFSSLRFPSSTSLSPDGSGQGVSRSQSVPKLNQEPNLTLLSTSSPGYLSTPGFTNQPPQMGVDPTAPMVDVKNLAPPPTVGFIKQALQRK